MKISPSFRTTVVGMVLLCAHAAPATIAGHWRIERPGTQTQFVVIDQVGFEVTFTYDGIAFNGDVADDRLRAFGGVPVGFQCGAVFGAAMRDRDRRLYGGLFDVGLGCAGPLRDEIVGERCECFDGNVAGGDGCDANCHVEPCFTCSGDPSVCVPVGDSGPCDDRLDCTEGETCSAGACTGGTAVDPCFDLSGPWRWYFDFDESDPLFHDIESAITLVQRDGYLMVLGASGSIGSNGPIDPRTGMFDLSDVPRDVKDFFLSSSYCVGGVSGHPTAGGNSLEAESLVASWGASFCAFLGGATVTGSRCIHGTAGEQCIVAPTCTGDCDNDGQVFINELVMGVNIALDRVPIEQCSNIDTDASGTVDVSELTTAVLELLHGCAQ